MISRQRMNRPFKFGERDRRELIVKDSEVALRIEYDGNDNPIYVGRAIVGTLDSQQKWQIAFLEYSGNNLTSITWPQNPLGNASTEYEFVWDDRATYTYS